MHFKKIDIRWTDLDPNRHVSNSSLLDYFSTARMAVLEENGFSQRELHRLNIGPVVFQENIYYFREALPGGNLYVSMKLKGLSRDGRFFEFEQNLYDQEGKNLVRYEMMGGWINLKERQIATVPEKMKKQFDGFERSADFRTLTKENTREHGKKPIAIDPGQF